MGEGIPSPDPSIPVRPERSEAKSKDGASLPGSFRVYTTTMEGRNIRHRRTGKRASSGRAAFAGTAAALACLLLAALTHAASLDDDFVASERHWAVTAAKFEISLKRFRLRKTTPRPRPVILMHGLLVNSRFLDFGADASLAEYLAEAGFDVWNLSLRGTGRSLNPLGWGHKPWTLDHMVSEDLPAAVAYVREETGSTEVLAVGYELGALLALAHVGTASRAASTVTPQALARVGKAPEHAVAGIVSIAAPMSFDASAQEWLDVLLTLERHPTLRDALFNWSGPGIHKLLLLMPGFEDIFYNPRNMAPEVKEELLNSVLTPVNRGVLDHLAVMVENGEFVSADAATSYRAALSDVRIPVLVMGGAADPIAPPEALRTLHSELASEDRELTIAEPDSDEDGSYGHFDLILGRNAKAEVFPVIRTWLEAHDGK